MTILSDNSMNAISYVLFITSAYSIRKVIPVSQNLLQVANSLINVELTFVTQVLIGRELRHRSQTFMTNRWTDTHTHTITNTHTVTVTLIGHSIWGSTKARIYV